MRADPSLHLAAIRQSVLRVPNPTALALLEDVAANRSVRLSAQSPLLSVDPKLFQFFWHDVGTTLGQRAGSLGFTTKKTPAFAGLS